jgi:hypothetical protein
VKNLQSDKRWTDNSDFPASYPRMVKYGKVPISNRALRQAVQRQPVVVGISIERENFIQFLTDGVNRINIWNLSRSTGDGFFSCEVRTNQALLAPIPSLVSSFIFTEIAEVFRLSVWSASHISLYLSFPL